MEEKWKELERRIFELEAEVRELKAGWETKASNSTNTNEQHRSPKQVPHANVNRPASQLNPLASDRQQQTNQQPITPRSETGQLGQSHMQLMKEDKEPRLFTEYRQPPQIRYCAVQQSIKTDLSQITNSSSVRVTEITK